MKKQSGGNYLLLVVSGSSLVFSKVLQPGPRARLLGASVTQTASVGVRRMPNEEPPL